MIPLVPITPKAAAPLTGGGSLATLWQDMLRSWLAYHLRMADLGLIGGI